MRFNDIIAANAAISGLERSVYHNIVQSLIFEGVYGTGKKMLSNIYANALICLSKDDKPCQKCKGCILFNSSTHPDIIYIKDDKKKAIGIDAIREMQREMFIRPNENGNKVFIIDNAHTLTAQAQNALLKMLEEPPEYASIILLCQNSAGLLETVVSRCVKINMPMLNYNDIVKALIKKGIDEETAKINAVNAMGSLGKAYELSNDPHAQQLRETYCSIFFAVHDDKVETFARLSEQKDRLKDVITCWQSLTRDCILLLQQQDENIENIDKIDELEAFAHKYRDDLIDYLDAVCEAEARIMSSSQLPLTIDWLMTKMHNI